MARLEARALNVIATRGEGIYLLDVGEGQGVVLHTDVTPPKLYAPRSIASHAKWGYWEDFEGDPAPILKAAAEAEHVESNEGLAYLNPDQELATRGGFKQGDVHLVDREGNELPYENRPIE